MDRASYDDFTAALTASLGERPEVLGLVAAGSFASGPDEWSDHDFLVVAEPSATSALRADPSWLPHHERLVLHHQRDGRHTYLLDVDDSLYRYTAKQSR